MLSQLGASLEERHIWNEPPSRAELVELASRLPGGATDLLSRRSTRYRELGLDPSREPAGEALLDLLAREPKLLRRPIISDGHQVVVGFDRPSIEAIARKEP